jgi:hypothetical protein
VLATCTGKAGHGGLARVLAGFCLGDGVLWVGSGEVTAVGSLQRGRGQRGGSGRRLPLLLHFSRLGSGQRGLGSTAEALQAWYRVQANVNSNAHSELDFLRFLPTTCSIKCPQEI